MAEQVTPKRCAIYVRKSTEQGLDQEYNSLDAQRDAALAYIKSQSANGWRFEKEYRDGGFSGGNTNRPGLKEMIQEKDWQNFCVDELSTYIQITDEERRMYFD